MFAIIGCVGKDSIGTTVHIAYCSCRAIGASCHKGKHVVYISTIQITVYFSYVRTKMSLFGVIGFCRQDIKLL